VAVVAGGSGRRAEETDTCLGDVFHACERARLDAPLERRKAAAVAMTTTSPVHHNPPPQFTPLTSEHATPCPPSRRWIGVPLGAAMSMPAWRLAPPRPKGEVRRPLSGQMSPKLDELRRAR